MSDINLKTAINLPSCLTPISGAICGNCGSILVTDGFTPAIFVFSACGKLINEIPTPTPYRFITTSQDTGTVLALGQGCQNRIICLDCCYNEAFEFTPFLNEGTIKSIYPLSNGRLLVSYPDLLAILNRRGTLLNSLRENNDPFTEFESAVPTCDGIILLYTRRGVQYLELDSSNTTVLVAIPTSVRLRNLTKACDGTVYAFGVQGYKNAFLVPIYANGSFICDALSTLYSDSCPL